MSASTLRLVRYFDPAIEPEKLQEDLEQIWLDLLSNPENLMKIAQILNTNPDKLILCPRSPIKIESDSSGICGSEIAILVATWVATDIALKALSELGKDALKSALKMVWDKYIERALKVKQKAARALGERESDQTD